MKYETREAFLEAYNTLKPYIVERQDNEIAICNSAPYEFYTIAYERLSDYIQENTIHCDDDDSYCSFLDNCTLKEYLAKREYDEHHIAICFSRVSEYSPLVINFYNNTIERDTEYMKHSVTEYYLITKDNKVYVS